MGDSAGAVDPRYLRQVLLAEVGPAGQRRLASATARLAGEGLAHEVAATYAARAGFARVVPGALGERAAPSGVVVEPAADAVLRGSRAALAAILAAAREGAR
jgi:hypothetical protein